MPAEIANSFPDFFSWCFSLPLSGCFGVINVECTTFLFSFTFGKEEIVDAIQKEKPKLSSGVDGIPMFIIKSCCSLLVPVLMHIFNLSLSQGRFPELLESLCSCSYF